MTLFDHLMGERKHIAGNIDAERLCRLHIDYQLNFCKFAGFSRFLDTLPYNAHTSASDALWAGLPVLTQIGSSFAGRVAASLLKAINLPELITHSPEEYEALAIELALNKEKLQSIREKLARNLITTPLFDTPLYTKQLFELLASLFFFAISARTCISRFEIQGNGGSRSPNPHWPGYSQPQRRIAEPAGLYPWPWR
jgi:hypothetical protein